MHGHTGPHVAFRHRAAEDLGSIGVRTPMPCHPEAHRRPSGLGGRVTMAGRVACGHQLRRITHLPRVYEIQKRLVSSQTVQSPVLRGFAARRDRHHWTCWLQPNQAQGHTAAQQAPRSHPVCVYRSKPKARSARCDYPHANFLEVVPSVCSRTCANTFEPCSDTTLAGRIVADSSRDWSDLDH